MPGIGVITNPRSRMNLRNPRLAARLGYILGEKGDLAAPNDLDALDEVAERFCKAEIDVLCVNGGDGTLHKALTAMVGAYGDRPLPKIMVLRGGTMNTIGNGLGVRGRPPELLDYVVTRFHADAPMPTRRRWLMKVDGKQYGFLFGNGLISQFLEAYYEGGEPSPVKAAIVLFRGVWSAIVGTAFAKRILAPWQGTARVDGMRWESELWMGIACGTCDDIGLGFRPFWKAPLHPGRIHAVGVAKMSPAAVVRELPRIWRARQVQGEGFVDDVAQEIVLRAPDPISYMIDGDFHRGGTEVTVQVGPPVDFIVPEDVR